MTFGAKIQIPGGTGVSPIPPSVDTENMFVVQRATTGGLPGSPVYNNGAGGIGATLTRTGNGTLSIDGGTMSVGQILLVKNQANNAHNGIYQVTSAGASGGGGSPWVLTRTVDYDQASEISLSLVGVEFGSINGGRLFFQTEENPTVGTDPIIYRGSANTIYFEASQAQTEQGTIGGNRYTSPRRMSIANHTPGAGPTPTNSLVRVYNPNTGLHESRQLEEIVGQFDKGFYPNEAALLVEFPNTIANPNDRAGRFARVTDPVDGDVFYVWDTGANEWSNTGSSVLVPTWGTITGLLSDQTDLQTALNTKENIANKATNFITINNVLYPTTQAVVDYVTTVINTHNQNTTEGVQGTGTLASPIRLNINGLPLNAIDDASMTFAVWNTTTNTHERKLLSSVVNQFDKGFYPNEASLLVDYPNTIPSPSDRAGWFARVTDPVDGDVFYVWDTGDNEWKNTGTSVTVAARGTISGLITDQTDLMGLLNLKLDTTLTQSNILIGNASNEAENATVGGDVVVAHTAPNTATATIQPNAVDNTKLAEMPTETVKANILDVDADPQDVPMVQKIVPAPATFNSPGQVGQMAYDSQYVWFCVATDFWVRTARIV